MWNNSKYPRKLLKVRIELGEARGGGSKMCAGACDSLIIEGVICQPLHKRSGCLDMLYALLGQGEIMHIVCMIIDREGRAYQRAEDQADTNSEQHDARPSASL